MDKKYSAFYEPDVGNKLTSIAFEPTDDKYHFKKLKLLK